MAFVFQEENRYLSLYRHFCLTFMVIFVNSLKQNHHLKPPKKVENLKSHTKYYKLPNDSDL